MRNITKTMCFVAFRSLAVALIATGGLSLATGAAVAIGNPQIWRLKPTAEGIVNKVDINRRAINVTHGPIGLLNWPAMTMDFGVADDIDIRGLKRGLKITFTLARGKDGRFVIHDIRPGD
jgi:Cu/Ag efflux protein CusF